MAAPEHRLEPENRLDNHDGPDWAVYVLVLEDGCYYVGKSENPPDSRIKAHFRGRGAEWTQLHPPTEVDLVEEVETNEEAKQREQQLYTEYAAEHGVDKVRGGGYTRTDIDYSELDTQNQQ